MQSYPSPPRHGSSPPPHPLIRAADHEFTSGATSINNSKSASSHTPLRRSPVSASRRMNLAARISLPSPPRSVSPPAIYNSDRLHGRAPNDAVSHFPCEPEELKDRYASMRHRVAEVMSPQVRRWLSADTCMLSSESALPRSCGTFWTFLVAAWYSTTLAMFCQLHARIFSLKFLSCDGTSVRTE